MMKFLALLRKELRETAPLLVLVGRIATDARESAGFRTSMFVMQTASVAAVA